MSIEKGIRARNIVNKGSMAAGDNAVALQSNVNSGDLGEAARASLQAQLQDLRRAIAAQANSLDNAQELLESTDDAAKELKKKKPNKLTFTSVISGIASAVKTVSGLSAIAQQVLNLAGKLL